MVFTTDNLLERIQEIEGSTYKEILWVDGIIYGGGGFNRYYINTESSGELKFEKFEPNEVLFSAFHSNDYDIQQAENAGFRIFY